MGVEGLKTKLRGVSAAESERACIKSTIHSRNTNPGVVVDINTDFKIFFNKDRDRKKLPKKREKNTEKTLTYK